MIPMPRGVKRIVYFSADSIKAMNNGDEEMREWFLIIMKRQMEYNDILIISDKFYDTFGKR